jgi:hypothetical protein
LSEEKETISDSIRRNCEFDRNELMKLIDQMEIRMVAELQGCEMLGRFDQMKRVFPLRMRVRLRPSDN